MCLCMHRIDMTLRRTKECGPHYIKERGHTELGKSQQESLRALAP